MSTTKKQCAGVNATGEPCRSPIVGKDGFCPAHRPGGEERMRRLALKGAMASRATSGLASDTLGPLANHQDAKRWLEEIGRAVVTGRLKDRDAGAGIRAVEAWLKAEGERVTMQVVEELKAEVERLKTNLSSGPGLRVTG